MINDFEKYRAQEYDIRFADELKKDIKQEKKLLSKEAVVVIFLIILTWFRETYLYGWFN